MLTFHPISNPYGKLLTGKKSDKNAALNVI